MQFYTYESLKQLMLPSHDPNAQPNTLQTVCLATFEHLSDILMLVFLPLGFLGNGWLVMFVFCFKPLIIDAAFEEQ